MLDREEKYLVEFKDNYYMCFFGHIYALNCFVDIMYSDLGTARQFSGRVCIGVNGSLGIYYCKYWIHT